MTDRMDGQQDHDDLDDFFGAARRVTPAPSDALMARVLADAMAAQAPVMVRVQRPGWLAQLRDALGGWPAVGGLATAGVVGLAVGIAAPAGLGDLTAALLGQPADGYLVDLMPELDFDIAMDLSEG
jgi:hypothetical protein